MSRPFFLFSILLASTAAFPAEVYRCLSADGSISFQQTACKEAGERIETGEAQAVWVSLRKNERRLYEAYRKRDRKRIESQRKAERKRQASLRSRERFWDIRVPKIDSIFDNSLVPRTSWSPGVPPQHRKLVAATHRPPI